MTGPVASARLLLFRREPWRRPNTGRRSWTSGTRDRGGQRASDPMLVSRSVRGAAMDVVQTHFAAPPEVVDDDPTVANLMTTPIVAIVPGADLSVALHLLATHRIRHLP